MSEHTARIDEEMNSIQMPPSEAAAIFSRLLVLRDHLREQPKSLTTNALLCILTVQGECFREAGVLWTEAHRPGSLAERDAAGEITVRMAAPNEAFGYLLAAADEIIRAKS